MTRKNGRSFPQSPVEKDSKDVPSRSSLQIALRPREPPQVVSPLVSPLIKKDKKLTQDETNDQVGPESSKTSGKTVKSKCPCNASSQGKSWLMTCNSCGQSWHNRCANLKGDKLTKESIDSILKDWQCPWCFISVFPCPPTHRAHKTKASFKDINHANEFLASVVDSLEVMVDTKLTDVLKTNTASVEAIGKQLEELSKEITEFKHSSAPSINLPPLPEQILPASLPPHAPVQIEDTPLVHETNYIEDFIEEFLSADEEKELLDLLESQPESFVTEGNRGVLQFGEYYKYMGSKTTPKACPEPIQKIMDNLNKDFASKHQDKRYHYSINSCLVNRYQGNMSDLPEHSDDEGDICPTSSIFTVSLGGTRTVVFRNTQDDVETPVYCNGRSLYQMTRQSQDFFKHQIKPEPEQEDSTRYSLTFRAIHWSNFNSTLLVGDSNFGKVLFGNGKGKVGQATPGFRSFVPQVADINPLACSSYKNVVVMVGTNDLKKNLSDVEIRELYKSYKTKVSQIRKYNPKCKLFVCPVLPTKSSTINQRIFRFNKYICDDLIQSSLDALLVEGLLEFVDNRSGLLRNDFAVNDVNDILHINSTKGVRLLVKLIKRAIFSVKLSRTVNGRSFANVTRGGPLNPV